MKTVGATALNNSELLAGSMASSILLFYEVREDNEGEYFHLITLWKSTKQEIKLYEQNN